MKDLKIVKYAVSVDVDIMQENGMGREEIKKWFNTPCDSEEGYNGYLAEDIPAGNYTLDQLNEIVDERLDEVFGKEPISNVQGGKTMSAFDTLLREITELTDCNCHSEARIEIASFFFLATGNKGFKKMEQVFDWICREVEDRQGRDCHQLISQREELTTAMFTLADKLGYSSASQAFQQRL